MNRTQTHAYQSAFRDFSRIDHWHAPHAVTLTLKQGLIMQSGILPHLAHLTREAASQNYRHFLNVLNRSIFGKASIRSGKRTNSISVIEGGNGTRLHIHAVIDCPRDDILPTFPAMIKQAWSETQWGHHQIDVQPDANSGWITYISKNRDKPDFANAIDWTNFHTLDCRV
jgi:hypothetical protein